MSTMRRREELGFTLIEVMVALVIIMFGVLGLVGMQAMAVRKTHNSQLESLVAIQAHSLASAMQANPRYWHDGRFPASFTVSGNTLSDSTLDGQSTDCSSTYCDPAQQAGFDVKRWGVDLQNLVPAATGSVSCQSASPNVCIITVNWTQKVGAAFNAATTSSTATTAMTYTLRNEL